MSSFRPPGNNQYMVDESGQRVRDEGGSFSIDTTVTSHGSTVANNRNNVNNNMDKCLFMSTTTWSRDSHELFDYEARHVHRRACELKRAAKIFRTTLDVQIVLEGHPLPAQAADFLLSIRERDGKFSVHPADRSLQLPSGSPTLNPKKLWLIVKELPTGNHQLQESDVIKLGRFKLRVKQLVKTGAAQPELRLDDVETPHSVITPEEASTMQCRICLLEGGTSEDPLLCPCQCKGSIKFVHLDCLRRWINGRLSLSDDQEKSSFFFKQLQCELCKATFPSAVFLNNDRISIVRVPKIDPPFIILENIVGAANKGLHIVSMNAKKELKLGRGHESDVRIADVSISRYHATIRFSDGEFILEDHQSKFGTLVSLRKIQLVEESHPLAVQVGRTVLTLTIRKPSSLFEDISEVIDDIPGQTPKTDPEDDLSSRGGHQHSGESNYNNSHQNNSSAVNNNNNPIGSGSLHHHSMHQLVRGNEPAITALTSNNENDHRMISPTTGLFPPCSASYEMLQQQQQQQQRWNKEISNVAFAPEMHRHGLLALSSLISRLPNTEQVPYRFQNNNFNLNEKIHQDEGRGPDNLNNDNSAFLNSLIRVAYRRSEKNE